MACWSKKLRSFALLATLLQLEIGNAFAQPNCSDQSKGLTLDELPSAVVALTYTRTSTGAEEPSNHHIGNGVLVETRKERLLFLTAHHVLNRACEVLFKHPNTSLVVKYQVKGQRYNSHEFRFDEDRCKKISRKGFQKKVDIGFFEIPVSVIPSVRLLQDAPILDRADQIIAQSQYFGYKPFPSAHTDGSTLVATSDPNAYAIGKISDRGWSGTPVFRKIGGAIPKFFLAGLIFSSPEIGEVLDTLNDQERPGISDKRIGVVSASVLRAAVANEQTLVVRLARYQFEDWVERSSEAINELDKLIHAPDGASNDDIRTVVAYLESLSSSEQFDATAYLLRQMQRNDQSIKWSRAFLLPLVMSVHNWCYYNSGLENHVLDLLRKDTRAYSRLEVNQVVQLVGIMQKQLRGVFTNAKGIDNQYVFRIADQVFSLLYTDPDRLALREELIGYGVPKKLLSAAVYDHARVSLAGLEDNRKFKALAELSLKLNPENSIVKWALADHLVKTRQDITRAVSLYNQILKVTEHQRPTISNASKEQIISSRTLAKQLRATMAR